MIVVNLIKFERGCDSVRKIGIREYYIDDYLGFKNFMRSIIKLCDKQSNNNAYEIDVKVYDDYTLMYTFYGAIQGKLCVSE